jgi:hypothetical protein
MSISDNPFLGPQWEPLGLVVARLLETVTPGQPLVITTYGRRYSCDPSNSPFVQACASATGGIQLEVAANLTVEPQLSAEDFETLEFFGWQPPEVQPEAYQTDGGNPNFVRFYDNGFSRIEVAEFILTTLVAVYKLTVKDFFGFNGSVANLVATFIKLDRLARTASNPNAVIFALPGQHLSMARYDEAAGMANN